MPRRVRARRIAWVGGLAWWAACGVEPTESPESTQAAVHVAAAAVPAPVPKPKPELETTPEPAIEREPEPPAEPDESLQEPQEPEDPAPFNDDHLAKIAAVQPIVDAAAQAHGVDASLINAVIWVESKFERKARGPAGAQGLMQLMPKTAGAMAKRLGRKRNSYDPDFNIHAGTLLLSRMLDRFDGDVALALAAYNRGGGVVSGWVRDGVEMPERTRRYVDKVLRAQKWFVAPVTHDGAVSLDQPDQAEQAGQADQVDQADVGTR